MIVDDRSVSRNAGRRVKSGAWGVKNRPSGVSRITISKGRRMTVVLGLMALGSSALAACGSGSHASSGSTTTPATSGSSSSATGKPVTGRIVTFTGSTSPDGKATTLLAQLASKYSSGTITFKTYEDGQLGPQPAVLQQLENGSVEMIDGTTVTDSLVKQVDVLGLPYLFPNYKVASDVVNSPIVYKDIWDKFLTHGIKVLGVTLGGYGDILSQKPITGVASFSGLRWRTPSPVIGKLEAEAVGANPTPLAITEVFTALSTHTIDAGSDPPATFVSQKWYEVAKYVGIINDVQYVTPWLVNLKWWNSLSSSQQQALQKAVTEAVAYNRTAAHELDASAINTMKKAGLVIDYPSIPALAAKMKTIYPQLASYVGGASTINDITAAVKADGG